MRDNQFENNFHYEDFHCAVFTLMKVKAPNWSL